MRYPIYTNILAEKDLKKMLRNLIFKVVENSERVIFLCNIQEITQIHQMVKEQGRRYEYYKDETSIKLAIENTLLEFILINQEKAILYCIATLGCPCIHCTDDIIYYIEICIYGDVVCYKDRDNGYHYPIPLTCEWTESND